MSAWPYPLWIAHRGAGKLAPENTLAAFRLGASHGYRAFECDLKLSQDGEAFLLHDDTLDRTTNGAGSPAEQDWAELARLDAGAWHSRAYVGEPLPRLAGIAAFCQANGCALNIELKPCPGEALRTGVLVTREAEQLWKHCVTPPLMSSFEPEALMGALTASPQLPRGLLLDTLRDGWFEQALSLKCAAVITHYPLMTTEMIKKLHAAGMKALVYTVNDPAEARRLIDAGIDGLITDAVDRFSPT
jgi:glycerophosphoryl diester phosphodiesterase